MRLTFTPTFLILSLMIVATGGVPAAGQEYIRPGRRRIVGGEPTDIKNHPWQVALNIRTSRGPMLCP